MSPSRGMTVGVLTHSAPVLEQRNQNSFFCNQQQQQLRINNGHRNLLKRIPQGPRNI